MAKKIKKKALLQAKQTMFKIVKALKQDILEGHNCDIKANFSNDGDLIKFTVKINL